MSDIIETWRPVKNYEGFYEVSSLGRVKSLARIDAIGRKKKEMILKNTLNSLGYCTVGLCEEGSIRTSKVHKLMQFAFGLGEGDIDHINRIRNDNRLDNLRICTRSQNAANSKSRKGATSRFKGVFWYKPLKKWQVQIRKDGRSYYLGRLTDEKEAARVYDESAKEMFGEFAHLNFPTSISIDGTTILTERI